ncbi:MAG: S1 RNA-binding domain-containing protein [Candidatus Moraniibacteriota bacterium]|nr:MAG: S1 RNA-binding domain-containing protein [Candidatus Moranbacteria bacterium]
MLENNGIHVPLVGDIVEGRVIEKESSALLLDLGVLGIGIVYGVEMRDGMGIVNALKIGDPIKAMVVDLDNEDGYIELSVRQASYERAWEDIEEKAKEKASVPTRILDANKGGLLVEVNGVTGFLPVSQLSGEHYPRVDDGDKAKILEMLRRLIGKELMIRVIDWDRQSEKLIVSEKAAQSEKEMTMISSLKKGDVVEGEVSGVVDFGAFVKFYPSEVDESKQIGDSRLEGLVHISELAWQLIDNPREIVKAGDRVKAKIIGIEESRISLSLKALKKDPWEDVETKYKVGDEVEGKVDKINPFGAFVYLDQNIHGLAHISEFKDVYQGKMMEEVLVLGNTYRWKILSIESKDHRMGLMLLKK